MIEQTFPGAKSHGADEEFNNYLPRKGYKIASLPGLSIGITFILPAPEAPKL